MENMASYCGESCVNCQERACGKCAGCKVESGAAYSGSCPVAACAERKGYISCGVCSQKGYCAILRECRRQREERHGVTKQGRIRGMQVPVGGPFSGEKYANNAFFAHLKFLIVLTVVHIVVGLFLESAILELAYNIAYAVTLIKMSVMNERFWKAGSLMLLFYGIDVALYFIQMIPGIAGLLPVLAVSVVQLAVTFLALLNEVRGYAELLEGMRQYDLGAKWRMLPIYEAVLAGVGLVVVLGANYSNMFGLMLFPVLIGGFVIGIMKISYLYKTEKLLRISMMETAE